MKATSEWFPAQERGLAGGVFNIGASVGSMLAPPLVAWAILAYNWQAAFVLTGALGLVWVALWLLFYHSPRRHPRALRRGARLHRPGQEAHLAGDGRRPSVPSILAQRNFWGIAIPRFLADPTWGTLTFWLPLYLTTVRHFDLKQIALFAWLPFLAADLGCLFGGTISLCAAEARREPDQRAARRVHGRRGADDRRGVRRASSRARTSAIALLSLAGFAHQTLSVTVITMASDLFRRNEVATVAGMAGTCGNAGVLVFSLLMGALVTTRRLHAVLRRPRRCSTCSAPWSCGRWCVSGGPTARRRGVATDASDSHPQSDSPRLQSRSVDRPRRRRLLHRDVDVRVVSRACRSTTRAIWCTGAC